MMHLSIGEASKWASKYTGRNITAANLSYLINYGRIRKTKGKNGAIVVDKRELKSYYASRQNGRETHYKRRLGNDLNWRLSFEEYKESETTKHVHRLHPYKGKFIPQLAEYFLDSHTDKFKTEAVFKSGDVILDPFCGSGTALVQANELGMHAIGVDVSCFNALIANLKLCNLSPSKVERTAFLTEKKIKNELTGQLAREFDKRLSEKLKRFNDKYFPSPEYKRQVLEGKIDENDYGKQKARQFLRTYRKCLKEFGMLDINPPGGGFMDTWYFSPVRAEIDAATKYIRRIPDTDMRGMMRMILSRTIRSCRATTHYDLATLREPMLQTYYCAKHGKICKPVFSILGRWRRYSQDTVKRLTEFSELRTNSKQICVSGDSRNIDLAECLPSGKLAKAAAGRKIRGILSSPPYVGLINYHEQHAYAYELFNLKRADKNEIGILEKGAGKAARENYATGVAEVLINCRRFMKRNFDVFLVANDKFGLYPDIAEKADMKIIKEYKRPVLNRAEGSKGVYGESIFHLRRR